MNSKKAYDMNQAYLMDCRFGTMKSNLDYIFHQYPRAQVLYPMMEKTIYKDFETLLSATIIFRQARTKNKNKKARDDAGF